MFLLRSENIFQREKNSSEAKFSIVRRLAEMREDKGERINGFSS